MKIFISYAHEDMSFTEWLDTELVKNGFEVWYDQKPSIGVIGGDPYLSILQAQLSTSDVVCVVLSDNSTPDDSFVMKEYTFAFEQKATVIPLIIDDCVIPLQLSGLAYIDFSNKEDYTAAFKQLMDTLARQPSYLPLVPSSATADPTVSVIGIDFSHGQDNWIDYRSAFSRLLGPPRQSLFITQDLSKSLGQCRVLILAIPFHSTLDDKEIIDVRDWVRGGKSIFLLGYYTGDAHHAANLNSLARELDFEFSEDLVMPSSRSAEIDARKQVFGAHEDRSLWVPLEVEQSLDHPIVTDVKKVAFLSSCSLKVLAQDVIYLYSPSATILHPHGKKDAEGWLRIIEQWHQEGEDSVPILAAWKCGFGKVVASGTWKLLPPILFSDAEHEFDNLRLINNVIDWLIT